MRVSWLVEAANRDRFNELARNNGMSASAMMDRVLERIAAEAGENDRLEWLHEGNNSQEFLTRSA